MKNCKSFSSLISAQRFGCSLGMLLLAACTGGSKNTSNPPSTGTTSLLQASLVSYNANSALISVRGSVNGPNINPLVGLSFHLLANCSDQAVGQGSEQSFQTTGIQVTVPSNQSGPLYVSTNIDTSCSNVGTYSSVPSAPPSPSFQGFSPSSPSTSVTTPSVIGTAGGNASQVILFSDSLCSNQVGAGSVSTFSTTGITASLQANMTNPVYAQSVEPFGKKSACVLLGAFINSNSVMQVPSLISVTPPSPTNSSTTPILIGSVGGSAASVSIFSDAGCSQLVSSGSASIFTSTGLQATVAANATTNLYAYAQDASGNKSPCNLLVAYVNDTIAPPAPSYLNSNPVTPTRLTIYPSIIGSASADTATLRFFSNASCKTAIGSGPALQFEQTGVQTTVTLNSTTTIYAEALDAAGNASACTHMVDFVNDEIAPDDPQFYYSTPGSPNNISAKPFIVGNAAANVSSVSIYSDSYCTGLLATGTATTFENSGIQIDLTANPITPVFGQASDSLGNLSNCVLFLNYAYSNVTPPSPAFSSIFPASPSRTSTTPSVIGTASAVLATINMYSNSNCSTLIGSNSRNVFVSSGVSVTVPANSTTTIYGQGVDIYGNISACVSLTSYTHDNIPPAVPSYISATPASPNNVSTTPTIVGTAPADAVTVSLYDSSGCTHRIGTGTAANFTGSGIIASVGSNMSTSIYGETFDAAGNNSACTSLTAYVNDTRKPGVPNFQSTLPVAPSYVQAAKISGTISTSNDFEAIQSVNIYSNSGCTNLLATGTPATYTGSGIPFNSLLNTTTTIYATTTDLVGNNSVCTFQTNFAQSNIGPSGLAAFANADGTALLSWQGDPNASYYVVKRSISSNGPFTVINPWVTSTSYQDSFTQQGITYYYVVDAGNASGTSLDSTEASITIGAPVPVSPSNLQATSAPNQSTLVWQGNASASFYTVYRGSQSGGPYALIASLLTSPNYIDTSVSNATSYFYVVTASNPNGMSGFSNEAAVVPESAPNGPTGFAGRWIPGSGFVLTWSAPAYYNQFNVLRGSSASVGGFAYVPGSIFSYADTKPLTGGRDANQNVVNSNYYAVSASWGNSTSSPSSLVGFAYLSGASLTASAGLSEVLLTWTADAASTGYQVQRATTPGGPYTTLASNVTSSQYDDTSVSNGVTYYYVITSSYLGSLMGEPSIEVNATPGANSLAAPTNLVVNVSSGVAQLNWSQPQKFNSFNVYRSSPGSGGYILINSGPVNNTNYLDTSATAGLNTYYVTATWGSNETSASNSVAVEIGGNPTLSVTGGTLSWTAVTGAQNYVLSRSTISGGSYSVLNANATSPMVDGTAVAGQGYFYVVQTQFPDSSLSELSNEVSSMSGSNIPSGITVTSTQSTSINLVWATVPNASSYKIYKSTASGGPYSLVNSRTFTNDIIMNLAGGTAYYFVVSAIVSGVESGLSAQVQAVTTAPVDAPTGIPGLGSIDISWYSNGADTFDVQRSVDGVNFSTVGSTTGSEFVDTGVSNGVMYFYRIVARYNSTGPMAPSPASYGLTPGIVPIAPSNLILVGNPTSTSVSLSWSDVPGATGYNIKDGPSSSGPWTVVGANVGASQGNTITGLTAGTPIYFVVSALIGTVESTTNSSPLEVVPSAAPSAPSAKMQGTTTIAVTWSAASAACGGSNPVSYDVQRSTDSISWSLAPGGGSVAGVSFNDTNFTNGLSYVYRYLPYCATGVPAATSSSSNPPVTPGIQPLAPMALVADGSSSTHVTLNWVGVPDASSYNVYRSLSSGGGFTFISNTASTSATDVPASGTYYYEVTALNQSGVESAPSNVVGVALALPAPTSLGATAVTGAIHVGWGASAGASSYSVKRALSSSGPFGLIASGISSAQLNYSDTSVQAGLTYYYIVTANNSTGSPSPDSNQASATALPGLNIEVPIELTDQALASNSTSTVFASTQTSFDVTAYDGSPTYVFEVVALNTDSVARNIYLLNSSQSVVATINVGAGVLSPTRLRVALTFGTTPYSFSLSTDGTTTPGLLQVLSAKLLVQQTNATKTKLYFPLLSSSSAPTGADSFAPLASVTAGSFVRLTSATAYTRNSTKYSPLPAYGTWEFEAVSASTGSAVGQVALWNVSQAALVGATSTVLSSGVPTLIDVPFNEGDTNFGVANDGNSVEPVLECTSSCTSGGIVIYKSGIWLTLTELSWAEISYRVSPALITTSSGNSYAERTLIDLSKFSSPSVNFSASGVGIGGVASIALMSDGTADSGTSGLSAISGSALTLPQGTSGSYSSVSTASPLTIVSGNRFLPSITPFGSSVQLNSCNIIIDSHQ